MNCRVIMFFFLSLFLIPVTCAMQLVPFEARPTICCVIDSSRIDALPVGVTLYVHVQYGATLEDGAATVPLSWDGKTVPFAYTCGYATQLECRTSSFSGDDVRAIYVYHDALFDQCKVTIFVKKDHNQSCLFWRIKHAADQPYVVILDQKMKFESCDTPCCIAEKIEAHSW